MRTCLALCLLPLPFASLGAASLFDPKPTWTSGSQHCGGDGNARLIDVDQDGDLDIVTSAPGPRRWVLFTNRDGRFGKDPDWSSLETTDCDHISVLDFNGDGRTDLAATHESHCTLYLNDPGRASGRFDPSPDWETGIYIDANQIDFGDYDQDGDQDMLMAAGLPFLGVAVFENLDSRPARTPTHRIGIREYSEASIFADYDSDGDLDIVATYPRKGTVILHLNNAGRFDDGAEVFVDEGVRHCQRVYCHDLDEDGVNELILAKGPWGGPGASVILKQQPGALRLRVAWRSAPQTGYHGFDFGDVDGDGDLDLVGADWIGRKVTLYLQDAGTFPTEPSWQAPTQRQGHEVMLGDVDGDGDLDLVAGSLDQAYLFTNRTR